eukprot:SM000052S17713  [mRNA]  locus=s52:275612:277004:- [translate_table: standard]
MHDGEQAVEELPAALQKIVRGFQGVPDPRMRYQQLLYYATKLKPLGKEHQVAANKVTGCVSQVWVLPALREGRIYFQAESDSQLTKGLAALLVEGLSGATPREVLRITPDFIQQLGLKQSLTPSRSNGFLNMLKLMQKKTLELTMEAECAAETADAASVTAAAAEQARPSPTDDAAHEQSAGSTGASSSLGSNGTPVRDEIGRGTEHAGQSNQPRYESIRVKLEKALQPSQLVVEDVSYQHAGHAGVDAGSSETHFNVKVVSKAFTGKTAVQRHKVVYDLLDAELRSGLHALSLVTKTPSEVERDLERSKPPL